MRQILIMIAALALLSQGAMAGTTGLGSSPFSSGGSFTHTDANAISNAVDDNAGDIAELVALSGVAADSSTLGSGFTGSTIPDGSTIFAALQAIETAYESTLPVPEAYDQLGYENDYGAVTKHDLQAKLETMGGSGDVTSVWDVTSGAATRLYQAAIVFGDGDATPDVSAGNIFITANTGATTITDFDTSLVNGQPIWIVVNDANTTFDLTTSGLEGTGGKDYTATDGDLVMGIYSTVDSQWHLLFWPSTISVSSVQLPNSDDPDVDAAGEISWDTDGWIRMYDGTNQVAVGRKIESIHATVITPQDLADAQRDAFMIWSNESGMSFVVTGWKGWSGTDDTTLNIEEADADGTSNNATVDAVELATGSGPYTGSDTTITGATIENGHVLLLDFDDTDSPTYVKITIYGYYAADVN